MLVQFMLKNVLSFKEETVLDMTAINAYKEHPGNLIDIGTAEKFLKVAAIYGANASGKSNLHMAMCYFQYIITESFNNVAEDDQTAIARYYNPFSFEEEEEKEFIEECKTIVAVPDAVEHQLEVAEKYGSNCIVLEKSYDDQKKMQEAGYTYYGQTDDYTVYFRE